MKGISGHFNGTFGTTAYGLFQKEETYSDRGITIPENIKSILDQLDKKGSMIIGTKSDLSMVNVSIMSKETGVEFARVTVGDTTYLIRGDDRETVIPDSLLEKMKRKGGSFDFHSHPHNDDLIPSDGDRKSFVKVRRITGQKDSFIITPNGRRARFNEHGVVSIDSVSNRISEEYKRFYSELFGR